MHIYEKGSPKVTRLIPACFATAMLLLCLPATRARADLTITASPNPVTLGAGDIGTMDFLISSTGNDTLSEFGLKLQITPIGTPTSLLQFTAVQSDPYGNGNYVFAGESTNEDFSLPFWGPAGQTIYMSDTILGGDM